MCGLLQNTVKRKEFERFNEICEQLTFVYDVFIFCTIILNMNMNIAVNFSSAVF